MSERSCSAASRCQPTSPPTYPSTVAPDRRLVLAFPWAALPAALRAGVRLAGVRLTALRLTLELRAPDLLFFGFAPMTLSCRVKPGHSTPPARRRQRRDSPRSTCPSRQKRRLKSRRWI